MTIFDGEVSILFTSSSSDSSLTTPLSSVKRVMLRITEGNRNDQKIFCLEIYDLNDVKFLYSVTFSRQKFEDVKKSQNLKYHFDQATEKIVSTVKETMSNQNIFISFTIEGTAGMFEFKRRDEHTDYAVLRLELEKITGARLNDHLINFIEQYKENNRLVKDMKRNEEKFEREISELKEEKDEIEADLRAKEDHTQTLEDEIDRLESDLNALKMSYDEAVIDNQKFVEELDEKDDRIQDLQRVLEDVKQRLKATEHKLNHQTNVYLGIKKKYLEAVNECGVWKSKFEKHEKAYQQEIRELLASEEKLKTSLEGAKKELEAIIVHKDLLTSQLNETEQRLMEKTKIENQRAELASKRVFCTNTRK